mgnify:CR=1 FL=1
MINFHVAGTPVPKQSFHIGKYGNGYRDHRVSAWQKEIAWVARAAMRGLAPFREHLAVRLSFVLPTRRRVDLDNLSKAVLDACNGIVWIDDRQVTELHLRKTVGEDAGVTINVEPVYEEEEEYV